MICQTPWGTTCVHNHGGKTKVTDLPTMHHIIFGTPTKYIWTQIFGPSLLPAACLSPCSCHTRYPSLILALTFPSPGLTTSLLYSLRLYVELGPSWGLKAYLWTLYPPWPSSTYQTGCHSRMAGKPHSIASTLLSWLLGIELRKKKKKKEYRKQT